MIQLIWNRKRLGTYDKEVGIRIRKAFKKVHGKNARVIFRGRGSRLEVALKYGLSHTDLRQDLPIKYAKKVAIYISLYVEKEEKLVKLYRLPVDITYHDFWYYKQPKASFQMRSGLRRHQEKFAKILKKILRKKVFTMWIKDEGLSDGFWSEAQMDKNHYAKLLNVGFSEGGG